MSDIDGFIAHWRETGGSELANTQSFINGLCHLIGVEPPHGSRVNDNAYVFERRVFQDNGDGTTSFGRVDRYKRGCFILEAKQGSEADRDAAKRGEDDLDLGETATVLPDNIIPWPGTIPEQVSAIQSILATASTPLASHDVARAFKWKRAATVRPVLDALTGIGMARRLTDGRYAA